MKKIFPVIACLAVALSMSACTSGGESSAAPTGNASSATTVASSSPASSVAPASSTAEESSTAPVSSEAPKEGTRKNPIAVGETVTFDGMGTTFDQYTVELTVTEVVRGEEAAAIVKEGNRFNDEAPSGKEYILVKFHINALDSANDEKINLNNALFDFVSKSGVKYDDFVSVAGLEPALTDVYAGGEIDGYVPALIDEGDSPNVVFLERNDGGIWFATE
ncbi:hypothetical protein [Solibaculum mannosilyticum]|uniref:DUF4352 domain-containing protein n=1 Tax=Solibaculum mannosilyticum TaxID=2780922 RepID=A0A7I8D7K5_9FIRM|nr:hypothetical protein [Solibaculum mannosilyticum]BCI60614.1 hypothetical protein C12CBH8_12530 [Solibaculum mannosilyticum]